VEHSAIDLSNFQSQFKSADSEACRAQGVEAVIIGRQRQNRDYEAGQAAATLDAGMRIIGEYWISVGGVWPEPLPESRFIAVDVEPGSEFIDEFAIDNALGRIRSTGRIPVIYSSRWAWDALGLRGVTKYGDQGIALWNAHYDGEADGFTLPYRFGGWEECVIDQFTDRAEFGIGYPLDENAISDEFWQRCYPSEEADVEIRQLDQAESIAALNAAASAHGMAINDQEGLTVVEVTAGSPVQPPPGGHVYLFTTKD
jgi:hypothetical protein